MQIPIVVSAILIGVSQIQLAVMQNPFSAMQSRLAVMPIWLAVMRNWIAVMRIEVAVMRKLIVVTQRAILVSQMCLLVMFDGVSAHKFTATVLHHNSYAPQRWRRARQIFRGKVPAGVAAKHLGRRRMGNETEASRIAPCRPSRVGS